MKGDAWWGGRHGAHNAQLRRECWFSDREVAGISYRRIDHWALSTGSSRRRRPGAASARGRGRGRHSSGWPHSATWDARDQISYERLQDLVRDHRRYSTVVTEDEDGLRSDRPSSPPDQLSLEER